MASSYLLCRSTFCHQGKTFFMFAIFHASILSTWSPAHTFTARYIRSATIRLSTEWNIQLNTFPDWLSSYLTTTAEDFEFIMSANHWIHQWKINFRSHHCNSDSWADSWEGLKKKKHKKKSQPPTCSSLGRFHQGIWWYLQSESISENFSHVNTWLSPLLLNMNEAD